MGKRRYSSVDVPEAVGKTITSLRINGPEDGDDGCDVILEFSDHTMLALDIKPVMQVATELIQREASGDLGETLNQTEPELLPRIVTDEPMWFGDTPQ